MKEYIKETQPMFYQLIEHQFLKKKIPHAFLLVGNQVKDALDFLMMSLVCKKEVLACGNCEDCRRIKEHIYPDLIYYNGESETIKKGQIERIQDTFKKTAIENNVRIYVLENIENSTTEAMNSLLKMLEEPTSNIYAVFTAKNIHRVLPTIRSRCQVIEIKESNRENLEKQLLEKQYTSEDAKILSYLVDNIDQAMLLKDERYDYIKLQVINTVEDMFFKKENLIINTQTNLLKKYNTKEDVRLFLDMLVIALKDLFHVKHGGKICFTNNLQLFQSIDVDNDDIIKKIECILEANYALDYNANVMLLMDSLLFRI